MSKPVTSFTDLGYVPEIGFTYENVFGGQGPNYTPLDTVFDTGGAYSFPEGTTIGLADGSEFDLNKIFTGTKGTGTEGGGSFLDVLAANVGGLGADIATLFGGSSSGKGKKGADAIADYVKKSTGILNDLTDETEAKVNDYAEQVYPGLTGLTGEEALSKYYDAFSDTITRIEDRGLNQLAKRPEIDQEYDRLSGRVGNILNNNQYNLASQAGGYGNIARGEGVVQMDQGRLDAAGDRLLNAKYKQAYDYGDPQTSKFIYGSDNTANAIGKYYNTSGDVAGLMSYGAVG
jgi:hypothetical protein